MWVTVGRNQELWKTCCKWTSPRREWGHCDPDCRALYLSLVRLVAVPVYTARNGSGIKLMSGERKGHCWHCIMSLHSPFDDFQNLNAHQGTAPKTRNGLYFAIGMNAIRPDCWCIDDCAWILCIFAVHPWQNDENAQLKMVWIAIQIQYNDSSRRRGEQYTVYKHKFTSQYSLKKIMNILQYAHLYLNCDFKTTEFKCYLE